MSGEVRFDFEGREITARPGQSIAGALHAAGVRTLSWSPKFRRPRGYRCGMGVCPGCTVRVDGLPGVLACLTPVRGRERVARVRPRLAWLPADRFGRLVPAGFQEARLLRGTGRWRVAERLLAHLAGQAPLPEPGAGRIGSFEERAVDVLVIGAGRTGLQRAGTEAAAGRSVLLVERDWLPGGSLLLQPDGSVEARRLVGEARVGRFEMLLGATAIGEFEEGVQGVVTADGLLAVRASLTVHATGSRDREVSLPDGDRPGVLLASAVRRLILREGVRPGRRAVVVASDAAPDGLASLLRDAGVEVVTRCAPPTVEAIHGRSSVSGVTVAGRRLSCDLVVIDAGRRPADELARQAEIPEEPRVG